MKTRKLVTILAVAGTALFFASCSDSANDVDDVLTSAQGIKSTELLAAPGDSCDFTATLSEKEIEGILEMREEEKLAHDVYLTLYETHGHVVFSNIAKSEKAHTSAVLHLINGFGLIDPAYEEKGEFANELYATLYKDLTEKGNTGLAEALKTGAFIEEYDIADLQRLLEETENETITRVYGNLLRGSKNHIRAFTNALKRIGETYTPTVISQEEYESILNETTDDNGSNFTPGTGICDGTGPNT